MQNLITEGIADGIVKPITRVVYNPVDVSRAFRLLSRSKHRGKVLLRMRDGGKTAEGLKAIVRYINLSSTFFNSSLQFIP